MAGMQAREVLQWVSLVGAVMVSLSLVPVVVGRAWRWLVRGEGRG